MEPEWSRRNLLHDRVLQGRQAVHGPMYETEGLPGLCRSLGSCCPCEGCMPDAVPETAVN